MREALKDSDVRWAAAHALGDLGPRAAGAAPALLAILKDKEEPFARAEAAYALGAVGADAKAVVPALRAALDDRTDAVCGLWAEAAFALLRLGESEAGLRPIIDRLAGEGFWDTVVVLGRLERVGPGCKGAVPLLVEALKHKKAGVRCFAAVALGQVGPGARDALPALAEAARDKEANVQDAATEAMKKIDPEAARGAERR